VRGCGSGGNVRAAATVGRRRGRGLASIIVGWVVLSTSWSGRVSWTAGVVIGECGRQVVRISLSCLLLRVEIVSYQFREADTIRVPFCSLIRSSPVRVRRERVGIQITAGHLLLYHVAEDIPLVVERLKYSVDDI